MLKHVTDAEFEEQVLQSKVPVMVDFWATWCPPCRAIAPALESIAEELGERATIAKIDTDENPLWSQRFGIMSIPTLIIFKDGKEVSRLTGAAPRNVLFQRLNSLLTTT